MEESFFRDKSGNDVGCLEKLFMEVVDKHAPLQSKRVSDKHSPWITHELTRQIYKRNCMKKIAIQKNNTSAWVRYKQARNEVNNAIKSAKERYFIHNLLNLEVNKKLGYWLTS